MDSIVKNILEQTHSKEISTRKKENYKIFEDELLEPNDLYKDWFIKRGYETIKLKEFIDILFQDNTTVLHFKTKSLTFTEEQFGFEANVKIHLYDFFKMIPEIFLYK
jgi:regulatory protein YycH of two-component signal transduction system YycFG